MNGSSEMSKNGMNGLTDATGAEPMIMWYPMLLLHTGSTCGFRLQSHFKTTQPVLDQHLGRGWVAALLTA
jgi:hypothetical protein